ncbi:MAG: 50S ribosomal protein L24 [Planctomycetota bacterium]|jgi:large subunit ribosomal protein L24
MPRIRKGDFVEVISGNERGKRGRVLRIIRDKNRVVVQGVNLRWKHMRKSQQNPQGGRLRREMPVHLSNVMIYDEEKGTRTRVAFEIIDGKKQRVGRRTGTEIGASTAGAQKKAKKKASSKKSKEAGEE